MLHAPISLTGTNRSATRDPPGAVKFRVPELMLAQHSDQPQPRSWWWVPIQISGQPHAVIRHDRLSESAHVAVTSDVTGVGFRDGAGVPGGVFKGIDHPVHDDQAPGIAGIQTHPDASCLIDPNGVMQIEGSAQIFDQRLEIGVKINPVQGVSD
ncbi:MAG: hypothetical protein IPL59_23715 [Candidatus Competibacteraceae bacterium]|nr:hypothetical protein [Candidatus Competibacteraceae bacterium]